MTTVSFFSAFCAETEKPATNKKKNVKPGSQLINRRLDLGITLYLQ
jgi:hypothetical protein